VALSTCKWQQRVGSKLTQAVKSPSEVLSGEPEEPEQRVPEKRQTPVSASGFEEWNECPSQNSLWVWATNVFKYAT